MADSPIFEYDGIAIEEPDYRFILELERAVGKKLKIQLATTADKYDLEHVIVFEHHVQSFCDRKWNDLRALPASIANLAYLKYLFIENGHHLAQIPRTITRCTSLRSAHFLGFDELPGIVCDLPSLKELKANPIRLPDAIGSLRNLTWLDLSKSGLKSIPTSIGTLKKLEFLDLGETNITELPGTIGNLRTLKELRIDGNFVEKLPVSMIKLTNLEVLGTDVAQYQIFTNKSSDVLEVLEKHCGIVKSEASRIGFPYGEESE
nr:hypothetical protein [Candidatus Sigynarchaeota archaeon]